jgi:hypothetical protein
MSATTSITTTSASTTAVDRLLEVVIGARAVGDDIYADGAVLDATVPGWRFTVAGSAPIGHQFAEWFRDPGHLEEVERHPTGSGEVVEYTITWEESGVPHAARHVHALTVVDDRIVRDHFWCGGRWPAPLLAQMEAARHDG